MLRLPLLAAGLYLLATICPGAFAEGEKVPDTRVFEWERGVAVESRASKGMAMFLWFYEWNMFDAVNKGEHTQGTFRLPRKVNDSGTQATIGEDDLRLSIKAVDGGADLLLTVTNRSEHDWPEVAGIIPCFSPGMAGGKASKPEPSNPAFANEKSYFLGPDGLVLLNKREIHFNAALRRAVEARSKEGKFVFSEKWPTARPDAHGGLLVRTSTDGRWVSGIAWEDFLSAQGHNPWQCMHLCVRVGPLARKESRNIRGKIYLFQGTKEELLKRYREDFKK